MQSGRHLGVTSEQVERIHDRRANGKDAHRVIPRYIASCSSGTFGPFRRKTRSMSLAVEFRSRLASLNLAHDRRRAWYMARNNRESYSRFFLRMELVFGVSDRRAQES
jgi:hypothetical protein